MGLDVHDVGNREITFEPDMTLAVEPALYIENMGVRWENTIRITEAECEILTLCDTDSVAYSSLHAAQGSLHMY